MSQYGQIGLNINLLNSGNANLWTPIYYLETAPNSLIGSQISQCSLNCCFGTYISSLFDPSGLILKNHALEMAPMAASYSILPMAIWSTKKSAISIVLFAACLLVVHAEVETFYSDSTCTTAQTTGLKTQTWTGTGLCKQVVRDSTDGASTFYRKFVCSGTTVTMDEYSDSQCTGTPSSSSDVTTLWPSIISEGCYNAGAYAKFDAALSASSWGENCGTGAPTNSPTNSPIVAPTGGTTSSDSGEWQMIAL